MRRLMWVVVVLAILWSLWWAVVGFGLKSAQSAWFEERRAAGWQADYKALQLNGFPTRVRSDMEDVILADTRSGVVLSLPRLSISVPTYWPGDVTLVLPDEDITFSSFEGKTTLRLDGGVADLRLHPNPALALESLSALSGPWALKSDRGSLIEAETLKLRMDQSVTDPKSYHFIAHADGFRPGDVPRLTLKLPNDWPKVFDILTVNATIGFDQEWDLSAIEERRPQPRKIDLKLAEAKWSDLRLFFAADVTLDETGLPTGKLNIQAENWQAMLDMGQRSGILPASLRAQIESGLSSLSRLSGDPQALDLQVNFKGGFMFAGFVPLGPAPRIQLR